MLEMLINPSKAEKYPWLMFFIGVFYSTLSLAIVNWVFGQDPVLGQSRGILTVTICVMFTIPFMYFVLRKEEEKDLENRGFGSLLKEHGKALTYLMFLFLGFVIGFSFWYITFKSGNQSFGQQVSTFCVINRPGDMDRCVAQYGIKTVSGGATAFLTAKDRIVNIFANNIYVLIFTLVFSLIFGAGAIFILAWNASVISAAIGIFSKSDLGNLPLGLLRYMIHGIPEIAAYFAGALAGGIISVAVIKHDVHSEKFWVILQDSLNLIIFSVVILFIAALIEVFVTPIFF